MAGREHCDAGGPLRPNGDVRAFAMEAAHAWAVLAARGGLERLSAAPEHPSWATIRTWQTALGAPGHALLARKVVSGYGCGHASVAVSAWACLPPPDRPARTGVEWEGVGVVMLHLGPEWARQGIQHGRWKASSVMVHETSHVLDPRFSKARPWLHRMDARVDLARSVRDVVRAKGVAWLERAGHARAAQAVREYAASEGVADQEAASDLAIRAYRSKPVEVGAFGAEALHQVTLLLEAAASTSSDLQSWRRTVARWLGRVADGSASFAVLGLETLREDDPPAWRRLLKAIWRTLDGGTWEHASMDAQFAEHVLTDRRAFPFVMGRP